MNIQTEKVDTYKLLDNSIHYCLIVEQSLQQHVWKGRWVQGATAVAHEFDSMNRINLKENQDGHPCLEL